MNDILDLIDGAIGAHELSADAMRWSPEPVDEGQTVVTHDDIYAIIDEVHIWGPEMRFRVVALPPMPDPEPYVLVDLPGLRRWYK